MGRFKAGSDYGTCTQCVRFTFIGCNIFFAVLSLLGFIVGIWGIATADSTYGEDAIAGPVILFISSLASFGLCVAGIVGGIFMLRPFLVLYAIVLTIIVILEFASAVISFVYADNARRYLDNFLTDSIEDYRVNKTDSEYDEDINDRVATIQRQIKCCGVDNATDWIVLNPDAVRANGNVPPANCSCDPLDDDCVAFWYQNVTTGNVWEDGCLDTLELFARAYFIVVGVISFIIMLIEILFVVVAVGLTITITRAVKGNIV